jgi:hypothetical protein
MQAFGSSVDVFEKGPAAWGLIGKAKTEAVHELDLPV